MATTDELYRRLAALEDSRMALTAQVSTLQAQAEGQKLHHESSTKVSEGRMDRLVQSLETLEARLWWIAVAAGVGGAGVGGAAASGAGLVMGGG